MEKNLKKFHERLIKEKESLHEDDANAIDKEYHLDEAIKHLKAAQEQFYRFTKIKTDLIRKGKKVINYFGDDFYLEWTNHYERKEIEIDFLYPFYDAESKYSYEPSKHLEEYAFKIINEYEQRKGRN